jgi:hypothetical protein
MKRQTWNLTRCCLACLLLPPFTLSRAANTDKGDFFIFSKSKGAAIAAVPTVAAAPADAPAPCTQVRTSVTQTLDH